MDPICSGSFLMVSNENAAEAYMLMGVPKEDARVMADPASKNRYEVEVDGNLIRWQEIYPVVPKYNHTYNMKLDGHSRDPHHLGYNCDEKEQTHILLRL